MSQSPPGTLPVTSQDTPPGHIPNPENMGNSGQQDVTKTSGPGRDGDVGETGLGGCYACSELAKIGVVSASFLNSLDLKAGR
jgi:hypothetical protein